MGAKRQNPIGRLLRKAQNQLEGQFDSTVRNDVGLEQDQLWAKAVTWTLVGTTVIGFGLLAVARTEEIVVATGRLEPAGNVKEVRLPTGAYVETIMVASGDEVEKGQQLIRLNQESSDKEISSLETILKEKDLQIKETEEQLALKQKERQRTIELSGSQSKTLTASLKLERVILDKLDTLQKVGAIAELQYLQQDDKVNQVKGQLLQAELDGDRMVTQVDQQIRDIKSRLAGLRSEQAQSQARLTEVKVANRNEIIRSPASGTVFDLKLANPGYVTQDQSSEPIMIVVPYNKLKADVEIPSSKIGFVQPGQGAEISLNTYPASDFGSLSGQVTSVASDSRDAEPQAGKNESYFPATIELDEQRLVLKDGTRLRLQAGMSLTAYIKLRSVSYFQLIFNTFRDKTDSLRRV